MAQRRIQAKRMGRLFLGEAKEEDEVKEKEASILFSIASDDDLEDGEGDAALLGQRGGGFVGPWLFSSVATTAAPYPRPAPGPGLIDRLVRLCVCPPRG